ncbi:hypothetical protein [Herminiimonas sp. CN]|uniref:hypothetical protein n=1 Tax=Herminiimonas sp. CN TaxID=1349818 RepID=UPI00047364AB|nr:hypothetical protein [Herminiimonas sp. CN]
MTALPFFLPRLKLLAALLAVLSALTGCSPRLNWRQVQDADARFAVLLPAKPATLARTIDLDGIRVTMSMTAAEVDGVTFAVGAIALPDAALAPKALQAMQLALVRNINGSVRSERATGSSVDIVASGSIGSGREPARLLARFAAREQRVYQAIMVGRSSAMDAIGADAADTFFTSLKVR